MVKNNNKQETKKIIKIIEDSFKSEFLILKVKILKINIRNFIKKLVENNVDDFDQDILINDFYIKNKVFNMTIPIDFLSKYIEIHDASDIDEKVLNVSKELNDKKNTNNEYFDYVDNIGNKKVNIFNNFFTVDNGNIGYFYITEKNITLYNLREIAFKVNTKYKIIVLNDSFFSKSFKKLELFLSNQILGLNNINSDHLKYYLINSLINNKVGDLNFTYFFNKRKNHINSSIRYNGKYKFFEIEDLNTIDVNYIENDIINLGGEISGIITYTKINLGKASYRVLIIRNENLYYLNIRPFNSGFYLKDDNIEKSIEEIYKYGYIDISNYIIEDNNENQNNHKLLSKNNKAEINYLVKKEHAFIPFDLAYAQYNIDRFIKKLIIPKATGFFFINGPVGSGKSTSLMKFLEIYYEYNRKNNFENKNVLMIENPIEMDNSYYKQLEVDDEDLDDYKSILMAIKRADTDLVVVGELRNISLFGVVNEISMSQPVITTFHVSNIPSFLELILDYSLKNQLNYKNIFQRINYSICQLLINIEKVEQNEENIEYFYTDEEKEDVVQAFFMKLGISDEKTNIETNEELKILVRKLIDVLWSQNKLILKKGKGITKKKVFEESVSNENISNFLLYKGDETNLYEIYKYSGYENTILYKVLKDFTEGKILLDNIKFEEVNIINKIEIFKQLLNNLMNNE